jgi:hypothetical protein
MQIYMCIWLLYLFFCDPPPVVAFNARQDTRVLVGTRDQSGSTKQIAAAARELWNRKKQVHPASLMLVAST